MVVCDRCYREFVTYAALKRHYGEKHSKLSWPEVFENKLLEEGTLESHNAYLLPIRSRHIKLITVVTLILIVLGPSWFLYSTSSQGRTAQPSPDRTIFTTQTLNHPKTETLGLNAAIIDQVGTDLPDVSFVKDAEQTLTSSGFGVKYFAAADVTVDFYKRLPSLGYRLIVWRVHSAIWYNNGIVPFTSEPYDASKYSFEQLARDLVKVTPSLSGADTGPYYFGISILFVNEEMQGDFGGAIIILSSCFGLYDHVFADALIQRGASAVISWDKLVTITHTDMTTEVLLKALVQGSTVSQAVKVAMDKVGPDPAYGSMLGYYPVEGAQVTVWSLALAQMNQVILFTRTVELVHRIHLR